MRIHSSTITREELARAATMARVTLLQCDTHVSRKRAGAFEVTLGGLSKNRTQRFRTERAATYCQWGTFLAVLFATDPEMIAGPYDGLASFDAITRYAFDAQPYTTDGDDRVAVIFRDKVKG